MSVVSPLEKKPFNVDAIRQEFPILARQIDNQPLVYLDNAATTQKPQCVIDALVDYYSQYNSNVHRGAHHLADEATRKFEAARDTVATFIHAHSREEVIWTSGTTDSINLVAQGLAKQLKPGDEVVVTEMEHHANLVPWQEACRVNNAILKVAPVNDLGELDIDAFETLLSDRTALVAFPHVSNALGTINPIKVLTEKAKSVGALVLVDGAQGVAHGAVDVQAIGCDFYAFSAHKLFGPTGVGVLWGKVSVLEDWPVYRTGGEMIAEVSFQQASWNVLPYKFEAGTPDIAGVIATGEAISWFSNLDMASVADHEAELLELATQKLSSIEGLRIIGQANNKIGVVSFVMEQGHPADIGFLLDRQGIAIRTGHHCAEPLMGRFNIPGTARASFSIYNTVEEVEALYQGLLKVKNMLL